MAAVWISCHSILSALIFVQNKFPFPKYFRNQAIALQKSRSEGMIYPVTN